jgi:flagellar biosynthesis protein FlhF
MTMKRYQARDMRAALKQVRDEQGPDAVILSTQTIVGGVEVCAAADDYPATPIKLSVEPVLQAVSVITPVLASASAAGTGGERSAMSEELRSLRLLLERQMSALAWNDYTRREPQRAALLSDFTRLGVARDVAWKLAQGLPADALADSLKATPEALLAASLMTARPPTDVGGVVAVIGPPGSGKSTTLAKLAVRQVLEHGPDSLALITMDNTRLGATEQTRSLARLLGVSVNVVVDVEELTLIVPALQRKRLVLIDTAGVSLRNAAGMLELRTALAAVDGIQALLMLTASSQDQVLVDAIQQFSLPQLHSAVLTRVDEAYSLGGAIGALIAARLPVAAICAGGRIPEDLRTAHADELLARAVDLVNGRGRATDQELLAERFGGALHAA